VAENAEFLVAGLREAHFTIPPAQTWKSNYNLVPLVSGTVNLPKFQIIALRGNMVLPYFTKERQLPVKPEVASLKLI